MGLTRRGRSSAKSRMGGGTRSFRGFASTIGANAHVFFGTRSFREFADGPGGRRVSTERLPPPTHTACLFDAAVFSTRQPREGLPLTPPRWLRPGEAAAHQRPNH